MMDVAEHEIALLEKNGLTTVSRSKREILFESKMLKVLNQTTKRTIDILAGVAGLVILIPLTVIVAVMNFASKDKGPLFFSQERIGKDGKLFKMYKFRTMIVGADEALEKLLKEDENAREEYEKYKKLENDPRITKAGHFLRSTSLDEFPQFLNVLKGDMSLVGPRPYLPREEEDMGYYYYYVTKCKPGITGLWQVSGRSEVCFDERLEMDMKYYKDENVVSDIGLVAKTVVKTIKREGAA